MWYNYITKNKSLDNIDKEVKIMRQTDRQTDRIYCDTRIGILDAIFLILNLL